VRSSRYLGADPALAWRSLRNHLWSKLILCRRSRILGFAENLREHDAKKPDSQLSEIMR
jgi:hypothetical protein